MNEIYFYSTYMCNERLVGYNLGIYVHTTNREIAIFCNT